MNFEQMKVEAADITDAMALMAERTRVVLAGLNDLEEIPGAELGEVVTVAEQRAEIMTLMTMSLQHSHVINNHVQRANSDPEGYAGWLDKLVEAEAATIVTEEDTEA